MEYLERVTEAFSSFMWGYPLLVLIIGGGVFFLIYSRLTPFRYLGHALAVVTGKYRQSHEPGQINSFQALSTALSATIGMGNISGVAIAIATGGPGAIFWMWVSAIVGMATEFFTCSLAVMYRTQDEKGEIQGGPMHVIMNGLGKKWKPLAIMFCLSGMIGVLPVFQVNQYTQAIRDILLPGMSAEATFRANLLMAIVIIGLSSLVIFGGIRRIGKVAGSLMPFMTIVYTGAVLFIVFSNASQIIPCFQLIFSDAFSGEALAGGTLGSLIILGVKRGTFSSEAGLGTAPMAHGAAKTSEPIRQGLVAMLGPFVDTVIICTMTALALIITGVWNESASNGVTLTADAFAVGIPGVGRYVLILCITVFSLTTLFAYPYYGAKCFAFVFGTRYEFLYNFFYIASILVGALASLTIVMNLIDGVFALMAIPNMIAAIILAPRVREASVKYFAKLK